MKENLPISRRGLIRKTVALAAGAVIFSQKDCRVASALQLVNPEQLSDRVEPKRA